MGRLLKLQIRNIFKNKLVYVCLILELLAPIITYATTSTIFKSEKIIKFLPEALSELNGVVGLVGTIFIALFVCYDFNEGTTKNIIAKGYTRTQLLVSKYIASIIGIFFIAFSVIAVEFVLFAPNGIGYESIMLKQIPFAIVSTIAYVIFYATMSFILEKNGSAIIACMFVPTTVPLVISLIDSNLKTNIAKFLLSNVGSAFEENPTWTNLGWGSLNYLIYIAIFITMGILISRKKEIK